MLSSSRHLLANVLTAAALIVTAPAGALESPWVDTGKADVRLLAEGSSANGAPLRAGLEIRLAPGWHTYWRYPGDAGVPPRFDWSGSQNLDAVDVRWPAPERISVEGGLQSIGYHGTVVLPLLVRPADPEKPVTLRLKLDIGVCEKICIPAEANVSLDVPAGADEKLPVLLDADARVPSAAPLGLNRGFGVLSAKLERGSEVPRALVDVAVPAGKPFDLFAEGPTAGWALPLPNRIASGDGRARFAVTIEGAPPDAADALPPSLRLTLVGGDDSIEVVAPLD